MNKFAQLIQKLLTDGKVEEAQQAATDANRRDELFKLYGIT